MTDIRYQFLQVTSAYNSDNQLLIGYREAGNIIFDRERGTITVVKEKMPTLSDTTGYQEYGSGLVGASFDPGTQELTIVDNLKKEIKLKLGDFITSDELNDKLDQYYTKTQSSELFASKTTFKAEVSNLRSLENEVGTVKQDIVGLKQEDGNLDSRIDKLEDKISGLGNVFNFVRQVSTFNELPDSANPGDVYQVAKGETVEYPKESGIYITFEDNTEFYWTEAGGQERWEILGVNEINLDGYVKNGDVKLKGGRGVIITSGGVDSDEFIIPYATEANYSAEASYATSATSAYSATKALQDYDGNTISSTYVKLEDLCWHTLN